MARNRDFAELQKQPNIDYEPNLLFTYLLASRPTITIAAPTPETIANLNSIVAAAMESKATESPSSRPVPDLMKFVLPLNPSVCVSQSKHRGVINRKQISNCCVRPRLIKADRLAICAKTISEKNPNMVPVHLAQMLICVLPKPIVIG